MNLAGLLAYAGLFYLPIRNGGQWLKREGPLSGIYSYGDSAGLAPDFPFNDQPALAGISTKFPANVSIILQSVCALIIARIGLTRSCAHASFEI